MLGKVYGNFQAIINMTKTTAKENIKKTLIILDAHAILHRAYHALPEFFKQG